MASGRPRSSRRRAGPGRYDKASWDDWIEDTGIVTRLIAEDDDTVPHQRFVVRLSSGQTVLIAHNLDIAERVPVGIGDRVGFRGIFEWNPMGGVVHWTHRDPQGGAEDGYVRLRGRTFM